MAADLQIDADFQFKSEMETRCCRWKTTTDVKRKGHWFKCPRARTKKLLKLGLQGMDVSAPATISEVQRPGQVSHSCLFGGLVHVVLQGLMKRQPLLH